MWLGKIRGSSPPKAGSVYSLGHLQVGSYRYRSLIEGLNTL